MDTSQFSETRAAEMAAGVAKYLCDERALYLPASEPLAANWKTTVQHYFPKVLLDVVRTVILTGGVRIPTSLFQRRGSSPEWGQFSRLRASRFRHLH